MRAAVLILTGLLLAALIISIQISQIAVYHDGRCGAQKWERWILLIDFSERDYDEFGIVEIWTKAHGKPCEPIWIKGPLKENASDYWPRLHFIIATGARIEEIRREISAATDQEIMQTDPLGRTILHWLVLHRDEKGRKILIDELVRKGLSLDAKDSDGLSPRDWEQNYWKN